MARHDDDAMINIDKNLTTGVIQVKYMYETHTTSTESERSALRTAASDSNQSVLDSWFNDLPTSDDRRAWWAGLDGTMRNRFRAAFKLGG